MKYLTKKLSEYLNLVQIRTEKYLIIKEINKIMFLIVNFKKRKKITLESQNIIYHLNKLIYNFLYERCQIK
jgi:hypothetical protein